MGRLFFLLEFCCFAPCFCWYCCCCVYDVAVEVESFCFIFLSIAALISSWYLVPDDDDEEEGGEDDAVGSEEGFLDCVEWCTGVGCAIGCFPTSETNVRWISSLLDTSMRNAIGSTKCIKNIGQVEGRDKDMSSLLLVDPVCGGLLFRLVADADEGCTSSISGAPLSTRAG